MNEKKHTRLKNVVYILIIVAIIAVGIEIILKYNFNDFEKGIREKGLTTFSRDSETKYSNMRSYKMENLEYTDSIFSKNIEVKPNTPYRVTCMVKTENVQNEKNIMTGGAQIAITDTTECSESITGTQDWTKLTLMFNSKNRNNINVGFRLGGYEENSKGTVWFSDFKIEEGQLDNDNEWKMGCFLIKNMDINTKINGKQTNIKLSMTDKDIQNIKENIQRLPETLKEISQEKMTASCEIISIEEPLTSISYDEENEYYIDPKDAYPLIEEYLQKKEYDYIYVIARFGDTNVKNVLAHDWIGLGGMDYYGIGFSNIRLPDTDDNYVYTYNEKYNRFPEEVYVHEFLHTLERNEKEYDNPNIAKLHDYQKYDYMSEEGIKLKKWYTAYMQNTVKDKDGTAVGLTNNSYTSKPIHESNFKDAHELDALQEPQNLIEELGILVNKMINTFQKS